jgi:hypothetical protein
MRDACTRHHDAEQEMSMMMVILVHASRMSSRLQVEPAGPLAPRAVRVARNRPAAPFYCVRPGSGPAVRRRRPSSLILCKYNANAVPKILRACFASAQAGQAAPPSCCTLHQRCHGGPSSQYAGSVLSACQIVPPPPLRPALSLAAATRLLTAISATGQPSRTMGRLGF